MSEYQYYEFLALDRPLTEKQRAELRAERAMGNAALQRELHRRRAAAAGSE
jgi:hypothetical protein